VDFDRLRDEHGFLDCYMVVKDYVPLTHSKSREVFIPLPHLPGHAHVDFGKCVGVIGGANKIASVCFHLPLSQASFLKAYAAETTEAFLDGHASALAFFGGVPLSIL
jgi:transposase